jgi:hypothetical protein
MANFIQSGDGGKGEDGKSGEAKRVLDRSERSGRSSRSGRSERSNRSGRFGRLGRSNRSDRTRQGEFGPLEFDVRGGLGRRNGLGLDPFDVPGKLNRLDERRIGVPPRRRCLGGEDVQGVAIGGPLGQVDNRQLLGPGGGFGFGPEGVERIIRRVDVLTAHSYLPNEYSTASAGMTVAVRPVEVSGRSTLAETSQVSAIFHLRLPTARAR